MKKTLKDYIEIGLTLIIIAGLFMPYLFGVTPIDFIFHHINNFIGFFGIIIPIVLTVPLLLILIFKNMLRNSILKKIKVILLIIYLIVFVNYCYMFYNNFWKDFGLVSLFTVIISLALLISSLKYSITKSDILQNILLATMGLPVFLFFIGDAVESFKELDYGSCIINLPFILLYIIAFYTLFKNHKLKKTL